MAKSNVQASKSEIKKESLKLVIRRLKTDGENDVRTGILAGSSNMPASLNY